MVAPAVAIASHRPRTPDWKRVAYLLHLSRALDDIEESSSCRAQKCCTSFRRGAMTLRRFCSA